MEHSTYVEYVYGKEERMSSKVNGLRWVGITGLLLALAAILLLGTMGKGSTQEESESEQLVEKTGTVGTTQDPDGDTEYTLTADDGVFNLGAGPAWFYDGNHPLAPRVGKTVTVTGESKIGKKTGEPEIDVYSVTSDGQTTQIRSSGKPPWAGGPQVVGPKHPGFGTSDGS
jgi:hypothetical protein